MTEVVILTGVKETIQALKNFDKGLARKLNKVIDTELTKSQGEARALVPDLPPMSGWRVTLPATKGTGNNGLPAWNAGTVRAGITKTRAEGKVRGDYTTSAGAILNKSAAGAIFESAGYSSRNRRSTVDGARTPGSQFKRTLKQRFKAASRLTWFAVYNNREDSQSKVSLALEEAKAELRLALESQRAV